MKEQDGVAWRSSKRLRGTDESKVQNMIVITSVKEPRVNVLHPHDPSGYSQLELNGFVKLLRKDVLCGNNRSLIPPFLFPIPALRRAFGIIGPCSSPKPLLGTFTMVTIHNNPVPVGSNRRVWR